MTWRCPAPFGRPADILYVLHPNTKNMLALLLHAATTTLKFWNYDCFQNDVLSKYADLIPDIAYSNDTEKYKRNLLKIEVFFDDFNYEKIEEVEAYKVLSLLQYITKRQQKLLYRTRVK